MLGMFPLGGAALGQLPFVRPPIGPAVGWSDEPARPRRTRQELERKLAEQKADTFGRKWFDNFLAAQEAAAARAENSKSVRQREAIEEAVTISLEAVARIIDAERSPAEIESITAALNAAAHASRITASIKQAELAARLAQIADDNEADEEDIETLLLLS